MRHTFSKLMLCLVAWISVLSVSAEKVTLDQVNEYAKQQYRNRWKEAAMSIRPVLQLNDEGGYTFSTSIRFPGLDAQQVYTQLKTLAQSGMDSILSEDDQKLQIQTLCYLYSVSNQVGGFYRYHLCLRPVISFTAKAGEAIVDVSLQYYEVVKTDKGVVNTLFKTASGVPLPAEQWLLADRYPYNERGKMPLATAEAFTKSYALIQLLLEQMRQ